LKRVDLGFSVLSKIIELGFQPDIVTFSTSINLLWKVGTIARAVEFFDDMVARGCQPDVHTYNTIINGLCKILGKLLRLLDCLRKWKRQAASRMWWYTVYSLTVFAKIGWWMRLSISSPRWRLKASPQRLSVTPL